jgi:hypothetical protein
MTAEELQKVLESLAKVGGVYEYVRQAVETMNREPRETESESV